MWVSLSERGPVTHFTQFTKVGNERTRRPRIRAGSVEGVRTASRKVGPIVG